MVHSLQAEMGDKLRAIEKEFPSNYTYDYADWKRRLRWLSLPRFLIDSI
jgi:hypothetical protein